MPPFHRIAVVNRGEPAMRLLDAARELDGLETVALFTEPDRHARFVRAADHAVSLGAPTYIDARDGRRRSSYLDLGRLERALVESRADAAWVGWGFVAEQPEFAELCRRLGVVFVGPSPEAMRRLGDKITAKRLAEAADVPVTPWSGGPVEDHQALASDAARIGLPLMIKATAGGGGRGIRHVTSHAELVPAYESARAEALAAFGDPTVFLERWVAAARHIEVQVLGDDHGTMWALGVRDCTLQRRHQKILEESPSPALTELEDRELCAASVRLARAAGYTSAGTVEYLFDPITRAFSFMEVNARLQVEHPVTELVTGADLVKLQLHIAAGGRLEAEPPRRRGCAIEVRLCAEDPDAGFAPAPGRVVRFRVPTGPGIRVDTGITEGDVVPPDFDSMIAKLVVWGSDRAEALHRLRRAVADTTVVVRGGATNKGFLLALLDRPEVACASYDNGWLDRLAVTGERITGARLEVALLTAAVEAYEAEQAAEHGRFIASAARGRPRPDSAVGRAVELAASGHSHRFEVRSIGLGRYRVAPAGHPTIDVQSERFGALERRVTCLGRSHRVLAVAQDLDYLIEVDGIAHRIVRDAGGIVRAPMPAMVLAVAVKPGDLVAAGDRLVTLEAMKSELSIASPVAGRVRQVPVMANVQVAAGATLVVLEPDRDQDASLPAVAELSFAGPDAAQDAGPPWQRAAAELRAFFLGFDVSAGEARVLAAAATCAPVDAGAVAAQDGLLDAFADVHWLFRRRPRRDDPEGPENGSPQEHLLRYMKALDTAGAGLPQPFLDALDRALVHYGIQTRAPSREVESALLRIWKSHERIEEQLAPVESVLECRLAHRDLLAAGSAPSQRTLDRLIAVGEGRYPRLADLARAIRFHSFEEPVFERARRAAYDDIERCFTRFMVSSDPDERAALLEQLVDCPYPLAGLFAGQVAAGSAEARGHILSTMIRRYYRVRDLHGLAIVEGSGCPCLRADYEHDGRARRLVAVMSPWEDLPAALETVAAQAQRAPPGRDVVVELYSWLPGTARDPDALARAARELLNVAGLPRALHRVALTAVCPEADGEPPSIHYFTFRPSAGGYDEDPLYRGLHPLMGTRLHLWRLREFDLERLPSVEDVYLFHGVARANRRDERLFALVEVRDVTTVRDESGRVVQMPHFEHMLHQALTAIRGVQAQRPPDRRLEWNQVLLYVWPALQIDRGEIEDLAYRMAPLTVDLGLEQVVARGRVADEHTGHPRDTLLRISAEGGRRLKLTYDAPTERALVPLSEYEQKVVQCRRRGLMYPYELVRLIARGEPAGQFVELDLDGDGALVPVGRPPGGNTSSVVVGLMRNFTASHPDGMERVALLGDPTRDMGALAEPECRRIVLALQLAEQRGIPVEWFALSAGARISMASGTENMDWIARVLRGIVEMTRRGGEINIVVCGINVGAQPYWNAEATMLMHTRGILVMTPDSAMVLTGKQALDYSGSVSAEDNPGIGGYERIMGPNGEAQYLAGDLDEACHILLAHYEHTYHAPGERFPRRAATSDPFDRDVRTAPHGGEGGFETVGEIFSDANRGRKRPFAIRRVMAAVIDQDRPPLERWSDMLGAEIAVVWDAHLGGRPACLIGIESQPLPRLGFVPADGPDQWSGGTLFPRGAKKVARAINAASGNRPLVVLANLSGFDGSPESLRNLQLEYGAEIGRAVVNFEGPIVFCVVSRYHGGAFVVFSRALNPNVVTLAVDGSYASVIGGAPAAAVVFAREVGERTRSDPRVRALEQAIAGARDSQQAELRHRLAVVAAEVRSEKLGELADEFDRVHSAARALEVGSLDRIVAAADLRPALIEAVERGIERCTTSAS